ncbi:hypothetical protein WJX73_009209 [Symbiochloris irregularis]|uniref:Protein dpy-30 homolog n=1 Tax=Symbiochloris irregularis TaxID=706552 RepID=A0AAW1PA29_9CHLO
MDTDNPAPGAQADRPSPAAVPTSAAVSPQAAAETGPTNAAPVTAQPPAPSSQPIRQYLDATVVPVLMQGMQAVVKERPADPVTYLANFLLQHNPQRKEATTAMQS